jgi:hypothetical protein
MAYVDMNAGLGVKYTETSLWTNSTPTSSFSAQAVTLSQSMADFKYLKIKVAPSTTSTSGQYFEDIVLVSELQRTQSSIQEGVRDRLVLGFARTTYDYERPYYYASNTSIYFMATAQAGTNTTNNSRNIPLEILGLNELDTEGTISPLLWSNSSPTTLFAGQTIQLDLSEYDGILVEFKGYTTQDFPTATGWKCSSYASKSATQTQPMMYGGSSGNTYYWARRTMQATDTGVTFGTGLYVTQSAGGVNNNAYCIPMYIYGIKGSVV